MKFAVVENGKVTNIIEWDGESEWKPDSGEAILATDGVGTGWAYADGVFTVPYIPAPVKSHEELVAEADAEKNARIEAAKDRIVVWQTKLLMGRTLTPDETSSLNIWMDYIDAVTAVDTSTAPDINWPDRPTI